MQRLAAYRRATAYPNRTNLLPLSLLGSFWLNSHIARRRGNFFASPSWLTLVVVRAAGTANATRNRVQHEPLTLVLYAHIVCVCVCVQCTAS